MYTTQKHVMARTLSLLHPPDAVVELRVLGDRGTYAGYYTDRDKLIEHARNRSGNGNCYFTLNPAHGDCIARTHNKLTFAKRGMTTKDSEIVKRTAILLDFDPKRLTGIASTDAEHDAALQLARNVRDFLTGCGWPEPLFASSGNGAALFYATDLPTQDGGLVKKLLEQIAHRFDNEKVVVDRSVHNPARIVRLIGTLNQKGENMPDRPHRLATIIEAPEALAPVSKELIEQLFDTSSATATSLGGAQREGLAEGFFDVAAWLTKWDTSFQVEPIEDGVRYRLDVCPKKGAEHADGRTWIDRHNDGRIRAGCFHDKCRDLNWTKIRKLIDPHFDSDAKSAIVNGAIEDPMDCHRIARVILTDSRHDDGGETFALLGDQLHLWEGYSWCSTTDAEFERQLTRGIKVEVDRVARAARRRGLDVAAANVTTGFVANVRNAMLSTVPEARIQPSWLGVESKWPAKEILACSNGLVHLPSFVAGDEYLIPLTPRYFSTLNLRYDFLPDGDEPVRWLDFLDQVWPDDPASIALLQEWFGYLLTDDTSQQKMLYMFGRGGGGKSTILDVAQGLVGAANVASLKLPVLGESHALQTLVGKTLCIFPDASMPSRMDRTPVIETIKSLTGEDLISINPKHKPRYSIKLNCRLMVASNEVMELPDNSGALSRRLLMLRFTHSFADRPDKQLRPKLLAELPGILLWAIRGWSRLQEQGGFTEPESGLKIKSTFDESSSPIVTFIGERCVVDQHARASKSELFASWREWCEATDRNPGTREGFARLLFSAVPGVQSSRPRVEGGRLSCYTGIGLMDESTDSDFESVNFWRPSNQDEVLDYAETVARLMAASSN